MSTISRRFVNYGLSPLAVGFVVIGVLLIGATLMGIVDGLAVLTGHVPTNEEFILLAMLGAAAEFEREMEQLMDDPTSEGQRSETTTEGDDTSY